MIYSDCLTEARDARGDQLGRDNMTRILSGTPRDSAQSVLDHVLKGFYDFVGQTPLNDDLTIIVARKL